jgi:hypothetical protein
MIKNLTLKKTIGILILLVFLALVPFFCARSSGLSIGMSCLAVPISWIASGLGAIIGIYCMKLISGD